MTELRIGVLGVGGAMGAMIIRQTLAAEGCRLVAGASRPDGPWAGRDLGEPAGSGPLGIAVLGAARPLFAAADVAIDFTVPAATVAHAAMAAETGTPLVIGTTGLDAGQEAALGEAAQAAPIVYAPNMSVGVNLLFAVLEQVAAALQDDFDAEIVEMHHNRKIDAPSGTALGLGRAVARGRGVDFDSVAVLSREGQTGARRRGDIGFATLRGGDVVGEHAVIFAGPAERIEIGHRAAGREIFAAGALRAARWVADRPPGLYSMRDVLAM